MKRSFPVEIRRRQATSGARLASSSSARRAMLAPQSHAIQTVGPSTPASSSPHWRCSVKKASSSASRVTAGAYRKAPTTARGCSVQP